MRERRKTPMTEAELLKERFREAKVDFAEKLFSVLDFCVGLWVINPGLDTMGKTRYHLMTSLLPEWAWGLTFLLIGAFRLLALRTKSLWLRSLSSFWSSAVWLLLPYSFTRDDDWGLGIGAFVAFAVMNLIVYLMRTSLRLRRATDC